MFRPISIFILCIGLIIIPVMGIEADTSFGDGTTFSCTQSEAELISRGVPSVSAGSVSIYIGYRQLGNNKDPIATRFDHGTQTWCRTDYEVTPDDNTGYGLFWGGGSDDLYAVFSATGTQGDSSEDFRRFATNGWLSSYTDGSTSGGGPKVGIIAQIDPADGSIRHATFLTARLPSSGKTNSLVVTDLQIENGRLKVQANSWYSPRNPDKSAMSCSGSSPFQATFLMQLDLSAVVSSSADGCIGNSEAPPTTVTLSPEIGFVGETEYQATVSPDHVALPITFVWRSNGTIVRQVTINELTDRYTAVYPATMTGQTLQVTAENNQTTTSNLDPAESPLLTFNVVDPQSVFLSTIVVR